MKKRHDSYLTAGSASTTQRITLSVVRSLYFAIQRTEAARVLAIRSPVSFLACSILFLVLGKNDYEQRGKIDCKIWQPHFRV